MRGDKKLTDIQKSHKNKVVRAQINAFMAKDYERNNTNSFAKAQESFRRPAYINTSMEVKSEKH